MRKNKKAIAAFLGVFLTIAGLAFAKEPIFSDDFKKDKLNEKWEWFIPKEGPEYTIDSKGGVFIFKVPSDDTYDHWTNNNNAPQLGFSCPKGDWVFEAKIKLEDFLQGSFFHAALFVKFSEFDIFYWGLFKDTNLRLERSTGGAAFNVFYDKEEVWLQIKKENFTYSWSYRASQDDEWEEAGTSNVELEPEKIGFIIKTWVATDVIAEFSSVKIYGPDIK